MLMIDGDKDADKNSSFNGEDDVKSEALAEREKDYAGSISDAENKGIKEVDNHNVNYISEQSLGDCEAMEEKGDYSDGWLYVDDLVDEGEFCSPSTVADQQNESFKKDNGVEKDSSTGQSGPHVKTSAITGVGLQELLELIDKKLGVQDKKGPQVVERSIFDRKWRPSHNQESGIAVEQ
ncbi:GTP-binding protein [Spatholobus suberectus]|nr:GTP-binding protein [Spatholobus suberectus]